MRIEIQRVNVNMETENGATHAWVPIVNGVILENEYNKDGLFFSVSAAKRGAARHLKCNHKELKVDLRK